jgi:4-hydroxybenzoate polyprenyltransferase
MIGLNRLSKIFFDHAVFSCHIIAIGAFTIALTYMLVVGSVRIEAAIGIYLVALFIHLADRYLGIEKDSTSVKYAYYERYRVLIYSQMLLSIALTIVLFLDQPAMYIFSFTLVFLGWMYSALFKKVTKYVVGFKSVYTALMFASSAVYAAYYLFLVEDVIAFPALLVVFLFFFLRWFANTIFCDLKDMSDDRLGGLKTFALYLGKKRLLSMIVALNILSILVIIIGVVMSIMPVPALILVLVPFYSFVYLYFSTKQNIEDRVLADVWADGESIIWLLMVMIGFGLWSL